MANKKEPIEASELEGFKYFKLLSKLLKRVSLGSLSETGSVFDPNIVGEIRSKLDGSM